MSLNAKQTEINNIGLTDLRRTRTLYVASDSLYSQGFLEIGGLDLSMKINEAYTKTLLDAGLY